MAYLWNPKKDREARKKDSEARKKDRTTNVPASRNVNAETGKVSMDRGGRARVTDASKRKMKTRGMIKHDRRR